MGKLWNYVTIITKPAYETFLKKYFLKTYKNNGGKLDYNVEKDKGILDRKIEIAIKKAEIEEKDRIPHIIEISFTAIVYKYPDICEGVKYLFIIAIVSILIELFSSYMTQKNIVEKCALQDIEEEQG